MTTDADCTPSRLVTRREAESLLGYAPGSLKVAMQQQARWPAPVACRLRRRALLWDLDALRAVARSGSGVRSRRPAGDDDDGLVVCLICNRRFRSLGPHLARAHETTAEEYRAEHRLPASTVLMGGEVRGTLSAARRAAMADDPELISRMREAALPAEELARRSAEGRAGTDDLPAVRAARRAGALRNLPAAQQARREVLEERARAAGYGSMAEAIAATRDVSARAAAERIGVGSSTVKRWRRKAAT
ncbi:MucR family transcriptional regulator [Streptomyces harbinensis]|uniref:MucR family transcriptional regulator n=1 Tax=Streptomyces harbinensis TaxID=1176198 RepID=UPI0036B3C46D